MTTAALAGGGGRIVPSGSQSELSLVGRANYIEHCAGCHGMTGSSAPARVPELRSRIGYFMCTPEGRDYLIRLPNVSHASLGAAELAELMNYVVFVLGDGSIPARTPPFAADEVTALRARSLDRTSLKRERARIVEDMLRRCAGVPASLRNFHDGNSMPAS